MSKPNADSNKYPDAESFPIDTLLVQVYRRGFDAGGLIVDVGASATVRVTEVQLNGMPIDPLFGSGVKVKPPEHEVFRVEYDQYGAEDHLHRLRIRTERKRDD